MVGYLYHKREKLPEPSTGSDPGASLKVTITECKGALVTLEVRRKDIRAELVAIATEVRARKAYLKRQQVNLGGAYAVLNAKADAELAAANAAYDDQEA